MLRAYGELPDAGVVLNGKGYVLHAGLIAVSFGYRMTWAQKKGP